MDYKQIETFLTIINNQSVTKAAEALFVSQSTISHRLKNLEDELGTTLITRHKGISQISLTEKGKAFVPIAKKWIDLYNETQEFSEAPSHIEIRIGAPDSMHTIILKDFYNEILKNEPQYMLSISTYPSKDIPELLQNHRIDIGFTYRPDKYEGMELELLGHLPLVIAENSPTRRSSDTIHPSQLDPAKELSIRGISNDLPEIVKWHKHWFTGYSQPSLTVDTPAMLLNNMNESHWCIIPRMLTQSMIHIPNLQTYELAVPIPDLAFYKAYRQMSDHEIKTAIKNLEKYEVYIRR